MTCHCRLLSTLLALFLLSATAFAQASKNGINIQRNGITVVEALKEVEKQSGLSIGFNNSQECTVES